MSKNTDLLAYLQELRSQADGGFGQALQRCISLVSKARSTLNPCSVSLLKDFGDGYISKRVQGHFAAHDIALHVEGNSKLDDDIDMRVRIELDNIIASNRLGDQVLRAATLRAVQQTRQALEVFQPLQDPRDVGLLRCCPPELLGHLAATVKKGGKRKNSSTPSDNHKRRPNAFQAALQSGEQQGVTPNMHPQEAAYTTTLACTNNTPSTWAEGAVAASSQADRASVGLLTTPRHARGESHGGTVPFSAETDAYIDVGDDHEDEQEKQNSIPGNCQPPPPLTPAKQARACRPFSGGWAIMVALCMEDNRPQTKAQLAALSAEHGLCREPLVKLQSTAGRQGMWYEPWSSCTRLRQIGWVVKSGRSLFLLTAAGQIEATRYLQQWHQLRVQNNAKTLEVSPRANTIGACIAAQQQKQQPPQAAQILQSPLHVQQPAQVQHGEIDHVGAAPSSSLPNPSITGESLKVVAPSEHQHQHLQYDEPLQEESSAKDNVGPQKLAGRGRGRGRGRGAGRGRGRASTNDGAKTQGAEAAGTCEGVESMSVLVDVREQPVIRASLGRLLASSIELQVPGIDYSFGRHIEGRWRLANVLLERKTVYDFHATLSCQRAAFQARVHKSLQNVGFRVAVILEGTNELKQHPEQSRLLEAAYACEVDVLTTASLTDTAELLAGVAAGPLSLHGDWGVDSLQTLLRPLYRADPKETFITALTSLGVARSTADSLARGYGEFHMLLEQLPGPGRDAETAAMDLASYGGITLFQAGKVLRAMGVDSAPLLKKRRIRPNTQISQPWEQPRAWHWGPDDMGNAPDQQQQQAQMDQHDEDDGQADPDCFQSQANETQAPAEEVSVEVGTGVDRGLVRCLKTLIPRVFERKDQAHGLLHVCKGPMGTRGTPVYTFGAAAATAQSLVPGRHWLLMPGSDDWRMVARARAQAYAQHGVVSSICISSAQAARHVAACATAHAPKDQAVGDDSRCGSSIASSRGATGLENVICLARTGAGAIPLPVAKELIRRMGCRNLYQMMQKLRQEPEAYLRELAVRDLGSERAAALRSLLLGL